MMRTMGTSEEIKTIVTHANCPDGVASAIVLKRFFRGASVKFLSYGSPEHIGLEAEKGMIFCDITPCPRFDGQPRGIERFVEVGAYCLDHHPTQQWIVEAFGDRGVYANGPGICGATLAYDFVLGGAENTFGSLQNFVRLAAIRDTWQRQDPDWTRACQQACALTFGDPQHWVERAFHFDGLLDDIHNIGAICFSDRMVRARRAIDESISYDIGSGVRAMFIDGVEFTSDVADIDDGKHQLIVGYTHRGQHIQVSTRSRTGFDCASLAKKFGGGGHKEAAGWVLREIGTPSWLQFELARKMSGES